MIETNETPAVPQGLPLTPEQTRGWPHTPGVNLFKHTEQAYSNVYRPALLQEQVREQVREQQNPAVPAEDFQLADLFDELLHVNDFRAQALNEYRCLRTLNPDTPPRAHIIAIAITGSSPTTIGIGAISQPDSYIAIRPSTKQGIRPATQQGDQPEIPARKTVVSFSQLSRDPHWLGMDPILPLFENKHALIIGDPSSGRPYAAVGLMGIPELTGSPNPPPENPENIALQIILAWHGATVHWLPLKA